MPMSTLELRPSVNYGQNTYGDDKYNVMGLVRLYSQDPTQLPWNQRNAGTSLSEVQSVRLPTINSFTAVSNHKASVSLYGKSASRVRLNLPIVARGEAHSSLAPFASIGKPTCGYFFSRSTDQRKMRMGIPPTFGYLYVTAPPVGGMR